MQYQPISSQIINTINASAYPLIVSHEKPDGDTLGAGLAMSQFLTRSGKKYKYFCPEEPADYFSYLPNIEKIINNPQELDWANHDLIIVIDCASLLRTGLADNLLKIKGKIPLINIDHHQSNDYYAQHNLVMPKASSTSEIIYKIFELNNIEIDKYMATALLTGILTDTMNFTNAITTKESLEIASKLLNFGARLNQIVSNLNQNKNLSILKLWGKVFSQLEFNEQHNFVYTIISEEDLIAHQMSADEARDGLANFLSFLQNINFILVLTEQADKTIKGSLRTMANDIDVSRIAGIFGGGGHKKAAGFKISQLPTGIDQDWKNFIINAIINELNKT